MLKKNNLLTIFLFLLLTTVFFAKALFTKTNFIYGDTYLLYYPLKYFLASNLKNFYFPQWNPYISCGMPTVSDPVQQIFYPLTFLLLVFDFNLGYKLFIISHYFIAGIAAYILMKGLKCGTFASVFSGISFMFCGYMVFNHSNPVYIASAAWMPLAFYSFIKIFSEERNFFWSLTSSFFIGIQVLGGDIQLVYGELLFFLVYVLWNLKGSKEIIFKYFSAWSMRFILILFFTFLFSAVLILPMFFLFPLSDRSLGFTFQQVTKWSFHPLRIIEFLTPYIFGRAMYENNYWGMFLQNQKVDRVWSEVVYIGILPVIFSAFGLCMKRDKYSKYFLFLFSSSLISAFGSFTPVYSILYKVLPFFSSLRYPEKFLIFTSFALAILGGMGMEKYLSLFLENNPPIPPLVKEGKRGLVKNGEGVLKRGVKAIKVIFLCFVFFLFLLILFNFYLEFTPEGFKEFLFSENVNVPLKEIIASVKEASLYFLLFVFLSLSLLWFGLKGKISSRLIPVVIILILLCDLWQVGLKSYFLFREDYYSFTPMGKLVIDKIEGEKWGFFRTYHSDKFIKGYNYPEFKDLSANEKTYMFNKNTLMAATGINFGIFHGDFYGSFLLRRQKELVERLTGKWKYFDMLNIKYIFASKEFLGKTPYPAAVIHKRGEFIIFKNPSCLPRAFVVRKVKTYKTSEEALNFLVSPRFKPQEEVLVPENQFSKKLKEPLSPGSTEDKCEIKGYKANSISLKVNLKEPGVLVLLENFFPGWEAKVNGVKRDVVEADYAFMGIPLEQGVQKVEMNFTHPGFLLGIKITSFTFLFYILFLILNLVRKRFVERVDEALIADEEDNLM